MAFSAIYDACVLYPFEIRDVLMVAALTRCFTVYWTDAILDETTRNLIKDGKATEANMTRMVTDMKALYPYATIPLSDYEGLIPVMTNDPKDRHVLAAAVARGVNVIVTRNLGDFKPEALEPYGIEAQHPDVFVRHVLDLEPGVFVARFRERNDARRSWAIRNNKPPHSDEDVAAHLAKAEPPMPETSAYLLECLANPRFKKSPEVKNQMPSDFQPQPTGTLKLGGLTSLNVNLVNDTRITVPIPVDHHTFEELDAIREEGQWKNVVLSSIAVQLKTWTGPKVRTYSFLGKVIKTERGDGETLVTLDKYGDVELTDVDV